MDTKTPYKILYVDDEKINLELFVLNFKKDYEIMIALSALEGLEILKKENISLVITDLKMPKMNGMQFLEEIKKLYPDKVCIILSAYTEPDVMMKAINKDLVFRYMVKPWKRNEMANVIEEGLKKYEE